MAIKPFKALRFDPQNAGEVGDCIAPPYDVISEKLQKKLYEKNNHNIVRITKGIRSESDSAKDNEYTRAAGYLADWIEKKILQLDENEAIYAYVQNFTIGRENFERSGFVALGKLKPFGSGVRPHEQTLDGPKADRLNLMRATAAQFGQIFTLYNDPEKIADEIIERIAAEKTALIDFVDEDSARHRLFAIDETKEIDAIVEMMADKETLIADGHHRYETALNYLDETKDDTARYQMMTFVNTQNTGLIILPTHRLVGNCNNFDIQKLISSLKGDFDVTKFAFDESKAEAKAQMFAQLKDAFKQNRNAFGIYAADKAFYMATLSNTEAMEQFVPHASSASKKLDISILHKLILEKQLGIGAEQLASQSNVEYIKDIGSAIDDSIAEVDARQKQVVFFTNPTKIEEVEAIAAAGEKMPQKSTFFYPKIFTGLTINKLQKP